MLAYMLAEDLNFEAPHLAGGVSNASTPSTLRAQRHHGHGSRTNFVCHPKGYHMQAQDDFAYCFDPFLKSPSCQSPGHAMIWP